MPGIVPSGTPPETTTTTPQPKKPAPVKDEPTYSPPGQAPPGPALQSNAPVESFPQSQSSFLDTLINPKAKDKIGSPPPTAEQEIQKFLAPYNTELSQLGPEYAQEMSFLSPYINDPNSAVQSVISQAKAGPEGNLTQPWNQSSGVAQDVQQGEFASAMASDKQPPPGFGNLANAAKQYESTIPYADVLQAVLGAGKNEILYGSTVPNLSNINASAYPQDVQDILKALQGSVGIAPSGLPTTTTQGIAALGAPAVNPGTLQGGGNG